MRLPGCRTVTTVVATVGAALLATGAATAYEPREYHGFVEKSQQQTLEFDVDRHGGGLVVRRMVFRIAADCPSGERSLFGRAPGRIALRDGAFAATRTVRTDVGSTEGGRLRIEGSRRRPSVFRGRMTYSEPFELAGVPAGTCRARNLNFRVQRMPRGG